MKNNLAVAYSIARKNRSKPKMEMDEPAIQSVGKELYLDESESKMHFAMGGGVGHGDVYESGEEKGINKRVDPRNPISISKSGRETRSGTGWDRSAKSGMASMPSIDRSLAKEKLGAAKKEHKKVLGEMQAMPKPDLYADGGKVNKLHQGANEARKYSAQDSEAGVHTPRLPYPHNKESFGESLAGYSAKDSINDQAKNEHKRVLGEMQSMKKPNLYAEGGDVKRLGETYPWKGEHSSSTGVNAPLPTRETAGWHGDSQSEAGTRVRHANKYGADMASSKKVALDDAKHLHKQTLSELRSMKKPELYAYGGILGDEMDEADMDPRAGAHAELEGDRHMKMKMMSDGGFASPEWDDAGELGDEMLEQHMADDEYSKHGVINYARGGMAMDEMEMNEPTSQRLGYEEYLDELETGSAIANGIRKKHMAKGGMLEDEAADDNAIEHSNYADELNHDLDDDEMYSEMSALKDVGHASDKNLGSMGFKDDDSDQHDMVGAIRKKFMKR